MEIPLHLQYLSVKMEIEVALIPLDQVMGKAQELGSCAVDLVRLGKEEEAGQTARMAVHYLHDLCSIAF